jgi:hypothetical protein
VYGSVAAALVAGRVLSGQQIFDRYLLPVAVAVLGWLILEANRGDRQRSISIPLATAVGLGLFALNVSLTWNENRRVAQTWHVAQQLQARGVSAREIDAGVEWVGWHYAGVIAAEPPGPQWADPVPFYARWFPDMPEVCGVVSPDRIAASGFEEVSEKSYRSLPYGHRTVVAYRRTTPGCSS